MKTLQLLLGFFCLMILIGSIGYSQAPCPAASPIPNPEIVGSFMPDSSCLDTLHNGSAGGPDRKVCLAACEHQYATYCTPPLNPGSTYFWTVTGGTVVGGQGTNCVTILWGAMGSGTISVAETTNVGCTGFQKKCVKIIDSPIAAFTVPLNVCKNVPLNFINQSIGAVSYLWNFGDPASGVNNTSTLTNPTHTFSTGGTYIVTLIAYNACGCADSAQVTINVSNLDGPIIECPATVCASAKACYSTPSGCPGAVYNWSVIGGTIIGPSNTSGICVQWGAGPQGTVSLFITGCGTVCPETTTVVVPIISTTAPITGPMVVCAGASGVYSVPSWPGTYYTWTLSGGTIIAGNNTNAVQILWPASPSPMNYTINVAWNNILLGCSGSATMIVKVRPEFQIFGPPGPFCVGDITTFFATNNANWSVTGGTVLSGNGTNSAQIQWTAGGVQTVTATTLNPAQYCNLTATQAVTVVAVPPAISIAGPTTICVGGTYNYTATPSGAGYTMQWSITGGTIVGSSTSNPVTVQWSGPGTISVQQVMTTAPFCASAAISLPVNVLSIANITGPTNVCMDGTSTFTAGPANPNLVYTWTIEDGAANPSPMGSITGGQGTNSISVLWHGPGGSVVVKVKVCNLTLTIPVTIGPKPTPTITMTGNVCNPGGSVILTASGGYALYAWSNGGNLQSTVVFAGGSYTVTVTDAAGCTGTANVTVPVTPPPVASISTPDPTTFCLPATPMANLYALVGPGYQFLWSPGGQTTPSILAVGAGSYSVTVTDINTGCSRTSNIITLSSVTCTGGGGTCTTSDTLGFSIGTPVCNPVSFTSLATGGVTGIGWNFGDPASGANNTSALLTPSHTFTSAGYYIVTISGAGVNSSPPPPTCPLSRTRSLAIPVAADFSYVVSCGSVIFTDRSTHLPATPITSWSWTFAGGTPSTSSLQVPGPVSFATPGPHVVTLTVSDGTCFVTSTQTVIIPTPPTAAFTLPATACVGTDVPMVASGGTSWSWNFGDAATSALQSTSHAWATAGTYTVTLIVTDNNGCADTVSQSITITAPNTSCSISPSNPPPVCAPGSVTLTASPTGVFYQWKLNGVNIGGNTSSYSATQTGSYTVTITDASGCKCTTAPVLVIVNPVPPATITSSGPPIICGSGCLTLSAPLNSNYTYLWSDASTTQSIYVCLNTPGSYPYTVTVTDTSTGCSNTSASFIINVFPAPTPPTITASGPTIFCKGGSVTLTSSSAVNNLWSTGATTQSITVSTSGVYSVTVTNPNGCSASASITVTLAPDPDFSLFPFGCDSLCDTVKIPGPIGPYPGYYTYQWLFNGVPIPPTNGTNDTLTPVGSGTYSLILTGPAPTFCVDTSNGYQLSLYDCDDCKATICGRKWNDANGNHKFNYGTETGIKGWKIFLIKCNQEGFPGNDTVAVAITDSLGYYCFKDIPCGCYCIVEERRPGWQQTWPINPPYYCMTVTDSQRVMGVDFGNKFKWISIWATKDTVGVPHDDPVLKSNVILPVCYPWPIKISYQADPLTPFTTVFDGVISDNVNPLPVCRPGRYSILRKRVANYKFDRIYVNDTLRSENGDSIIVDLPDSLSGVSIIFLHTYNPDPTVKFRTFTAEQLAGTDQKKPVKRSKPGKPILMPTTANVIDEIIRQGGMLIAGLPDQIVGTKLVKGYLHPAKQGDVFSTFNTKDAMHSGTPRGFDRDVKGKLILKRQKKMPSTKHDNVFLANLLTLKINIAASQMGKTPPGFGELVYISPAGSSPWFVDGPECSINMIAAMADSVFTSWGGVPYQKYADINAIMESLNEAFEGYVPFGEEDTAKWIEGGKLELTGAVALSDVPFLIRVGGSVPAAGPVRRIILNEEPDAFTLDQNYPNPFNPTTTIRYTLTEPAVVTLKIFDVLGQEIATLVNHELMEDGAQEVAFDANTLSSGVYFYHLIAESIGDPDEGIPTQQLFSIKKMLLMK